MDQDRMKGLEWLGSLNDDDSEIDQARVAIAADMPNWGGSDWAATEDGREWLFYFLDNDLGLETASGTRRTLLAELDAAADEVAEATAAEHEAGEGVDEGEDEALGGLARLFGEDTTGAIRDWFKTLQSEVHESLEVRCYEPEFSDPYGMWYWYDPKTEEYRYHADKDAPPWQWLTQVKADEQVRSREAVAGPAREGEAGLFSEAVWDENWQMLYRIGPDGTYEYAYSDDQRTVRPGADWLSYAEVMQETAAPAQATAGTGPETAATPEPVAEPAAEPATGPPAGPAAMTPVDAAAALVDELDLEEALTRLFEQEPQLVRQLQRLDAEQLELVLGQGMAEGVAAAGVSPDQPGEGAPNPETEVLR
jgi:hypothetical protein